MAAIAAVMGALSNTLRLELVDLTGMPTTAAAFIGALTAGLLASLIKNYNGYPRISLTVPSIVIMVPGLYLYRAFYNLGTMSLSRCIFMGCCSDYDYNCSSSRIKFFARIFTDRTFRLLFMIHFIFLPIAQEKRQNRQS